MTMGVCSKTRDTELTVQSTNRNMTVTVTKCASFGPAGTLGERHSPVSTVVGSFLRYNVLVNRSLCTYYVDESRPLYHVP
jgi:hypothetical protein